MATAAPQEKGSVPAPRLRRSQAPDVETVRALYVDQQRTEREIDKLLKVPRGMVAETLKSAWIPGGTDGSPAPAAQSCAVSACDRQIRQGPAVSAMRPG